MRIGGIDIGGTSVKLGVFDTEKGLVLTDRIITGNGDPERIADGIADFALKNEVELLGVGTAGNVDIFKGTVTADNIGWSALPLRDMLTKRTGKKVWIDNDANTACVAEWYDGACKGADTAVYITLGTGVGGALIINGKPWRGHTNTACEFGHIITHIDGLQCSCTRKGCYEMYASAGALMRYTETKAVKEVMIGLEKGDAKIEEGFKTYLHELAIGAVSLIMVFNPQVFVVGGGLTAIGDKLLNGLRDEIAYQFKARKEYFTGKICFAQHLNDAGMIGSALLALERIGK